MARKIEVEIVGDGRSLERAFGRAGNASDKLGKAMRATAKVAAVGLGAALAGLAVSAKVGFSEFTESERIMAQTRAGLKSTGEAAGVTAKDITNLAGRISDLSGIDDEAVQAGENLLITFTKIRNETGKGNDIFNQATMAVADLATRMNQGAIPSSEQMAKASIQVGKALNDPIKGVGALRRVGVSFTEAQKEQIQALVESGRTMEAQKLILRELQVEFGGSAKAAGETLSGQLAKLRNWFDEVAGSVVGRVIPRLVGLKDILDDVTGFIGRIASAPTLSIALDIGGEGLKTLGTRIQSQIRGAIDRTNWSQVGRDLATAISAGLAFTDAQLDRWGDTLLDWVQANAPRFAEVGAEIAIRIAANLIDPAFWIRHWDVLAVLITARFGGTLIKGLVGLGGRAASSFIGSIASRVGALVGPALQAAMSRVPSFISRPFQFAADAAVKAVRLVVRTLRDDLAGMLGRVPGWIKTAFKVSGILAVIGAVQKVIDKIRDLKRELGGLDIPNPFSGIGNAFRRQGRTGGPAFGAYAVPTSGVNPGLWDEIGLGRSMGLTLTSGRRGPRFPGDQSKHIRGRAIDMAGPPPAMARFALAAATRPGIEDVFYDPLGGRFRIGGHSDHVHVELTGGPSELVASLAKFTGDPQRRRRRRRPADAIERRAAARPRVARARRQVARELRIATELPIGIETAIFDAEESGDVAALIAAHRRAVAFWEAEAARAGRNGLRDDQLRCRREARRHRETIAELQQTPEAEAAEGPDQSADLQAQLEQANRRTAAERVRALAAEALLGAGGGGGGAGGNQPVIQMGFMIPDSQQIVRAAEAITEGFGMQGFRVASQERTGV